MEKLMRRCRSGIVRLRYLIRAMLRLRVGGDSYTVYEGVVISEWVTRPHTHNGNNAERDTWNHTVHDRNASTARAALTHSSCASRSAFA